MIKVSLIRLAHRLYPGLLTYSSTFCRRPSAPARSPRPSGSTSYPGSSFPSPLQGSTSCTGPTTWHGGTSTIPMERETEIKTVVKFVVAHVYVNYYSCPICLLPVTSIPSPLKLYLSTPYLPVYLYHLRMKSISNWPKNLEKTFEWKRWNFRQAFALVLLIYCSGIWTVS